VQLEKNDSYLGIALAVKHVMRPNT
jgi:hypothetical protein